MKGQTDSRTDWENRVPKKLELTREDVNKHLKKGCLKGLRVMVIGAALLVPILYSNWREQDEYYAYIFNEATQIYQTPQGSTVYIFDYNGDGIFDRINEGTIMRYLPFVSSRKMETYTSGDKKFHNLNRLINENGFERIK